MKRRRGVVQVQVYGACLAGGAATACLIMELVPGGSLAARIYDRRKRRMSYLEILQVSHNQPASNSVTKRFCDEIGMCPMVAKAL